MKTIKIYFALPGLPYALGRELKAETEGALSTYRDLTAQYEAELKKRGFRVRIEETGEVTR